MIEVSVGKRINEGVGEPTKGERRKEGRRETGRRVRKGCVPVFRGGGARNSKREATLHCMF